MEFSSESRKEVIAQKFFDFFLQNGMVDTIISDVASSLHMSKKTIYKEFPNGKEEILYFIYAELAKLKVTKWLPSLNKLSNVAKKLETLLSLIFDTAVPHVLRNVAKSDYDYLLENRIVSSAFRDIFGKLILEYLAKGSATNEFDIQDPQLTFRFIYSIMSEAMVYIHETKNIEIKKQVLNQIFKLLY